MTAYCLRLPYQAPFIIQTGSSWLASLLRLKYGRYLFPVSLSSSTAFGDVPAGGELITVAEEKGVFTVGFRGQSVETDDPLQEIDRLHFENVVYDPRILALHGAAVEHDGRAHLFLASTTSGKTTLAAFLTAAKGCGYITDDCILLMRDTFAVQPCGTPVHLREGGLEVLRRCSCEPEAPQLLDTPTIRRYVYAPSHCIDEPVPLGAVYFIRRVDTPEQNARISLSANEKMTRLLKSPITDYPLSPAYLRTVAALAGKPCCDLLYGDMEYVWEVMQNG